MGGADGVSGIAHARDSSLHFVSLRISRLRDSTQGWRAEVVEPEETARRVVAPYGVAASLPKVRARRARNARPCGVVAIPLHIATASGWQPFGGTTPLRAKRVLKGKWVIDKREKTAGCLPLARSAAAQAAFPPAMRGQFRNAFQGSFQRARAGSFAAGCALRSECQRRERLCGCSPRAEKFPSALQGEPPLAAAPLTAACASAAFSLCGIRRALCRRGGAARGCRAARAPPPGRDGPAGRPRAACPRRARNRSGR